MRRGYASRVYSTKRFGRVRNGCFEQHVMHASTIQDGLLELVEHSSAGERVQSGHG